MVMRDRAAAWSRRSSDVRAGAAILIAAIVVVAILAALDASPGRAGFDELRLDPGESPVAIAAGPSGELWFTVESAPFIARLHAGRVQRLPKGAESVEPLGLAVDANGDAWFTEAARRRIVRISPAGGVASFDLATPVARLARLAVAPGGAVWFAEPTLVSVTRLHQGVMTRHVLAAGDGAADATPFGVAAAPDGTVWTTLPSANRIVRVTPDGQAAAFDVPTPASGLGDVAVAADGTVYFLEMAANKVGRLADGRFSEFPIPTAGAAPTALAVAPDGAVWFTELRGRRIGRLRDERIVEYELPRADARPFAVAVDADNNVWYADLGGWVGRLPAERARGG
jgi:virginiamycin B lyase